MTSSDSGTLYTLGDRGQTIDGITNDVRGREVKDKNGNSIGKVADLLIDDREQKVRFLLVEHGGFLGFGKTKTLIPVDAITKITQDEVPLDQTRERVASAPGYDPDLADDRPYHSSIYGYYGYGPFWSVCSMYPLAMLPKSPPQSQDSHIVRPRCIVVSSRSCGPADPRGQYHRREACKESSPHPRT